jgi:ferredoxin
MKKRIPTIDDDRCSGCGKCVDVCPQHAITLKEEPYTLWRTLLGFPPKFKAQIEYPEACTGCAYCVSVCRHRAIKIEKVENIHSHESIDS